MKTTESILRSAEDTLSTAQLGFKLYQGKNPPERLSGLRNLIVFGRAITNVLQNLRGTEGQKFDTWYQSKVDEMQHDEVLKFFYKLRSEILKEGTLNVFSSATISGNFSAILKRIPKPPGAKGFFIGDQIGGSGWEVEIEKGYTEKFYVEIPDNIPGFVLKIDLHFKQAPEKLRDKNIMSLATYYIDYMEKLVKGAKEVFL